MDYIIDLTPSQYRLLLNTVSRAALTAPIGSDIERQLNELVGQVGGAEES